MIVFNAEKQRRREAEMCGIVFNAERQRRREAERDGQFSQRREAEVQRGRGLMRQE